MATTTIAHGTSSVNYRNPTLIGIAASAVLTALVIIGSRNLENFDSALFGYTIASVVAFGAIFFRYAIWLQRPATRAYFKRGLQLFFQKGKLGKNTGGAAKTVATNLIEQRFIFKRDRLRWLMHLLIMWGCIIAALGPDAARHGPGVRRSITGWLRTAFAEIADMVPGRGPAARRRRAIAAYASWVGAMVLARAVDDRALSDEILDAVFAETAAA